MAYQITQINDQQEGDILFTTFVLTDDEGTMPNVRVDKQFRVTDTLQERIENEKAISCLFYKNQFLLESIQ
jgi:hypothetical protein